MRSPILGTAAFLAFLLPPLAVVGQSTIPVVVKITELIQLNVDQDPIPPSLGDFFAEVTIDGMTFDNRPDECDNPPPQGFLVPYPMFTEVGFAARSCHNVPWTFTADVPLSHLMFHPDGIDVEIKIIDEDPVFDDDVEDINLRVPFGGRWMGTVDWPQHCNRDAFP